MTGIFIPQLNPMRKPRANPQPLAPRYACRMDVFDTRWANLTWLSEQGMAAPSRLKKDMATALDMSASYLSQLLGKKRMGEDVARKIEQRLGLPHGWMDMPHGLENETPTVRENFPAYQSQALRIDPETIAAALKLVRLAFLNRKLEIDQEENGEPLAYAYEYLLRRQERAVTAENVIDFSDWIERKYLEQSQDEAHSREHRSAGRSHRENSEGRKAS